MAYCEIFIIFMGKGLQWKTLLFIHFRVQIFYSNFFTQSKSTKLVRDVRTLIFNANEFLASLEAYNSGSSKMPSNEVYLGFARQWFYATKAQLPITAIVRSRRFQSLVDTVGILVIIY